MSALPNPTVLSNATRFRPTHVRAHSRSPSRSPVRKAQFTAQHLDPLLRNLSPDSTLKALQATETIPAGPEEDVLTTSISDATPAEREIGIRAAFAAQKLRQWRNEILKWGWPGRRERGLGAGFLPPPEASSQHDDVEKVRIYLGYLHLEVVDQYEQRIDEIRDALETLEMEDIKDHVLQAHTTKTPTTAPVASTEARKGPRKSYGRMRDFTALITATVIQALPDLAFVSMLIETWDIRLTILRDLPMLLDVMKAARAGVIAATAAVRDPAQARLVTVQDFETTKKMLGDKVADFGGRIDRMLDLLDGQEDALPQVWIDSLELIELDYASWVVETQRVASQNQAELDSKQMQPSNVTEPPLQEATENAVERPAPAPDLVHPAQVTAKDSPETVISEKASEQPGVPVEETKPTLRLEPPPSRGHRREISEVSVADSAYSTYSDVSKAEIVDATQTQVLPSPKINVVDSPSRDKPPMLQRASTASIEVITKDQLRTVDLRRSMSADLIARMSQTPDSTPSRALEELTGQPRRGTTPLAELEDPTSAVSTGAGAFYPNQATSWAHVEPDPSVSSPDEFSPVTPTVPRKSSKRKSGGPGMFAPSDRSSSPSELVSPIDALPESESRLPFRNTTAFKEPDFNADEGSLEAKIQDILLRLPTKIRLTKNGTSQFNEDTTPSSSRASTPTPGLTLSPAKSSRRSSTNDTDVRVFHLTQHGQSRDSAPIKLFVRTVGENEERVMVRVGGGWADLGEYLKEYSLHHGHRNVSEGQLQVAQYPANQRKDSHGLSKKSRHSRGQSRSPSPPAKQEEEKVWVPPPVPPIPESYTVEAPTLTTITRSDGNVETTVEDHQAPTSSKNEDYFNAKSPPVAMRTSTATAPGVSTTTTVSIPQNSKSAKYTPLGAAGPKAPARRAVTFGAPAQANNEAWVEGMVGKARAVSSNTVQGPTTTTTTTVTSSAPSSRRTSALVAAPPTNQPKPKQIASTKESEEVGRRKSLLGLGDGGIRRVFLRRKSEK